MNIENQELKQIKKIYGEEMMHLCRTLFPTILEQSGLLLNILEKNFAPTRNLAFDIKDNGLEEIFKEYIYSFIEEKQKLTYTTKTPFELMKEKGYTLYECHSERDILNFKKYYAAHEELCTFKANENRIERCHVFFAVKDNVEEIIREKFQNPSRQDEYGTSVISIQFTRGKINTLSIKNRYNHRVKNPDATFSNNLENIIPGLTSSFEQYYGLNINQDTNVYSAFLTMNLQYVRANDGKYYRYNSEVNGIYYCENNIIIDHGNVIDTYVKEKERYIIMDYFVLDKKDKKVYFYDNNIQDSFIDSINELGEIKNIVSTKDKRIIIEYSDGKQIYIGLNKFNGIISYKNDYVQNIGNCFLKSNKSLTSLYMSSVKSIGDWFLGLNRALVSIDLPSVKLIGNKCLYANYTLPKVNLPKVEKIGNSFLLSNRILKSISLPNVKEIEDFFLYYNEELISLELLNAKKIGMCVLGNNQKLTTLSLPNVENIGYGFLISNSRFAGFRPQSNSERKR